MLNRAKLNRAKLNRASVKRGNLTQKELGIALLAIRKAMDVIDDGYHNSEIAELTNVSNELFWQLNEENRDKFTDYLEKKMEEQDVIKL